MMARVVFRDFNAQTRTHIIEIIYNVKLPNRKRLILSSQVFLHV